jgi:hypothetical protein
MRKGLIYSLAILGCMGLAIGLAIGITGDAGISQPMEQVVDIRFDMHQNVVYVDNVPYRVQQIKTVERGVKLVPIENRVSEKAASLHGSFFANRNEKIVITLFSNPSNAAMIVGVVDSRGGGKGKIDNIHDNGASFIYDCQGWGDYYGVIIALDKGFYYKGELLHDREYY